jgi:hypothetical protein
MITCGECGRINGKGLVGTNWICKDCKEGGENDSVLASNNDKAKSNINLCECELE